VRARLGLAFAVLVLVSCKRPRPPAIEEVWLGPDSGCVRDSKNGIQCFGSGLRQTEPALVEIVPRAGEKTLLAFAKDRSCIGDSGGTRCADHSLVTAKKLIGGAVLSLSVSETHGCVVHKTGEEKATDAISLACWGANSRGELGTRDAAHDVPEVPSNHELPNMFGTLDKMHPKSVAVGAGFTCVEMVNGEAPGYVRCFGSIDLKAFDGEAIKSLAAGMDHACVVKAKDGSVWCWGKDYAGQLGDGGSVDAALPVMASGVFGAVQVACGERHTCARHLAGTIACWGANDHHQLANGTTTLSTRPRPMHGLVSTKAIVAAGDATCVLLKDGDARCWGRNDVYQLGDGTTVEHVVPSPIKLRVDARSGDKSSGGW